MKELESLLERLNLEDARSMLKLTTKIYNITDSLLLKEIEQKSADEYLKKTLKIVLKKTSEYFKAGAIELLFRVSKKEDEVCFENLNPNGNVIKGSRKFFYINNNILSQLGKEIHPGLQQALIENADNFVQIINENREFDYILNQNNILLKYPNANYINMLIEQGIEPEFFLFKILVYYYYTYPRRPYATITTFPHFITSLEGPISRRRNENPVLILSMSDFLLPRDYDVKISEKAREIIEREIWYLKESKKVRDELGLGHTNLDIHRELERRGIYTKVSDEERRFVESEWNLPCPFTEYDMVVFDIYRRIISSVLIKANTFYEMKKLNEKLEEKNIELQNKNEFIEQLKEREKVHSQLVVQMQSSEVDLHEITNKVGGVAGLMKDIESETNANKDKLPKDYVDFVLDYCKLAKQYFEKIGKLINIREEFVKYFAGHGTPSDVELSDLLQEVYDENVQLFRSSNIELEYVAKKKALIYADPDRVKNRIIENFMTNIRLHSKAKHAKITLDVVKRENRDNALIIFEDDGAGIPQEKIDELYVIQSLQTDSYLKGRLKGSTIAVVTAVLYNGFVNIKSEKDKGTKIEVYLPLKDK